MTHGLDACAHFDHLLELIEIERLAERERNKMEVERYPIEVREALGKTAIRLSLQAEDVGIGGYPLITLGRQAKEGELSPFAAMDQGDNVLVSLTLPSPKGRGEWGTGKFEGTIYRVDDDRVTVALDQTPPGKLPSGAYQVDILGSEATYRRMAEALKTASKAKIGGAWAFKAIALGARKPRIAPPAKLSFINDKLNDFQRRAVAAAYSAPEMALIHGPPGTGKTTVLAEIILQAVRHGSSVLACAPSNIAVDNILERLLPHRIKAVRMGHPARISEALRHATLDALIEEDPLQDELNRLRRDRENLLKRSGYGREASALGREIRQTEKTISRGIISGAQVILATHGGFNPHLFRSEFDLAVLDEASQATEPLSWICLVKAKKAVLAGDTNQLPPTIYSQQAAAQGLKITLLERLQGVLPQGLQSLLRVQYRMHEAIMGFPSSEFYGGRLIAHESVKDHVFSELPGVEPGEMTTQPVIFIDTTGAGFEEGWDELLESRFNEGEIKLALEIYRRLRRSGSRPEAVGILTPYVAQARRLKALGREPGLEIGSIDGFQGREKEAIILSLVRSNEKGEVGFLSDVRRLNVGLTRARRLLIVIGDSATIARHPAYARFVEYAEKLGAHRSSYEFG